MKIFNAAQIKSLDDRTIRNRQITSWQLMERAAEAFTQWVVEKFEQQEVFIFCGPGNNGGDGLAVARLLHFKSYKVKVYIFPSELYSPDFEINLQKLKNILPITILKDDISFPDFSKKLLIDGIFGTGLNKPAEGLYQKVIQKINASGATIISIDIASGLYPDKVPVGIAVEPQYTVTFQLPKLAFMMPENFIKVGEWVTVDLNLDESFIRETSTFFHYTDNSLIFPKIKKRTKFSHKGDFGRALIIGGSYGMMGAAVLATQACYRTGAGLVRAYVPKAGYQILQSTVPEAMVLTDSADEIITELPDVGVYNAIGIGPGLSESEQTAKALERLLQEFRKPLVIDAGALNIISKNKSLLDLIPPDSILTPHPKEFERLTGTAGNQFERLEVLQQFVQKHNIICILKGAHSAVALPDGNIYFNSTGNAGMATGGSGDVLTGMITALLSQSYTPFEAALTGVFMHGYAGDCAANKLSPQSMMASDIIHGINDFYKAALQ